MAVALTVVVIGASSGGIEATRRVIEDLPGDLAAAVLVVIHVAPTTPSVLPGILARVSRLPVAHARHDQALEAGRIYVAPPDHHLIVNRGRLELSAGPRENHHRPAIDVTFRSAALSYRTRAIGVVLSGALDDGTAGLSTIKRHGGLTFVQDPAEAAFPSMPASAAHIVSPHHVLGLEALGASLVQHVAGAAQGDARPVTSDGDVELESMREGGGTLEAVGEPPGKATSLACPECQGPLRELDDGAATRFGCHTGHVFSPDSLFAGQVEDVERALWSAVRALDESARLTRRLLARASTEDREQRYRERLAEVERGSQVIREILRRRSQPRAADDEQGEDARSGPPG